MSVPNSDLAASRRRQFRLWSSFSYPQDSKTAGGNVPLQIPTLRRVAADNSAFRAVSAIRRIAKTADGCEPLQVPTFLKVGEGLKFGGRSGDDTQKVNLT